jgi:hypothetical protein
MYEFLELMVFYAAWTGVFVLCYMASTYQFRYCVPTVLFLLKVFYALFLLLIVRLYYLLRVENYTVDWARIQNDLVSALNMSRFEL